MTTGPWRLDGACRMAFPYRLPPLSQEALAAFGLAPPGWWAEPNSGGEWELLADEVDPRGIRWFGGPDSAPDIYDVHIGPYGDFFAYLDREVWRMSPIDDRAQLLRLSFAENAAMPGIVSPDGRLEALEKLRTLSEGLNRIEGHPELPPWQWRERVNKVLGPAAQLVQTAENAGVAEMRQRGVFLTLQHTRAPAPYLIAPVGSDTGVLYGVNGTKGCRLKDLNLQGSWCEVEQQLGKAIHLIKDAPYRLSVLVADGLGGHLSLSYPPNPDDQPQWDQVGSGYPPKPDFEPAPGSSVEDAVQTAVWVASRRWSTDSPELNWGDPEQVFAAATRITTAIDRLDSRVRRTASSMSRAGVRHGTTTVRPRM